MPVVKFGGSLMREAKEIMEALGEHRVLIVPGGGPFADAVRTVYRQHGLSEEAAHQMAILAMDLYGMFLSDISGIPGTKDPLESLLPAVLLPWEYLQGNDPFEPSWDVTSDTIACHVARLRGERELVLLKVVEGIVVKGRMLSSISADELSSMDTCVVDRGLPGYLEEHGMDCRVASGHRVEALLRGEPVGTLIRARVEKV